MDHTDKYEKYFTYKKSILLNFDIKKKYETLIKNSWLLFSCDIASFRI